MNGEQKKKTLDLTHPELAKEWHPTKNNDLTPQQFTYGSSKKIWWLGGCGHEWEAVISSRTTNGTGCAYCKGQKVLAGFNDLATTHPEIAKEWHPSLNEELSPQNVPARTHKKIWWMCKERHEWEATVANRSNGDNCPICSNRKVLIGVNNLATTHPELAKEWHPTKNDSLTPKDIIAGSGKKVWWVCSHGHEWIIRVVDRKNGRGCPYCANKLVWQGFNDLETTHPELAKEWHPTKNGSLTPKDIIAGSGKKVWWLCSHGHEWTIRVVNRKNGSSCPYCTNQLVWQGFNDLETTHPELAKDWHPTKNGGLTPKDVTYGSEEKVWWQCEKGHEWETRIPDRSKGKNCPYCTSRKILIGFNDLATTYPELAKEWDYSKNRDLTPQDITGGSRNRISWICKHGHTWKANIYSRKRGSGCPKCNPHGTSFPEQCLFFYLHKIFPNCRNRYKLENDEIDIFIPEIDLAVEYDGFYYHKNKEQGDTEKSKRIMLKIYNLLRIREEGLESLQHKGINCVFTAGLEKDLPIAIMKIFDFILQNFSLKPSIVDLINNIEINLEKDRIRISENYKNYECNNSISVVYPELAKEWHPTKNGILTPENFRRSSSKKVWWRCHYGHEWIATINNRAKGSGCPYCSGRYPIEGETDLATTYPELAKEWHPTLNRELTPQQVSAGSSKKVWWQCSKGHEWEAKVSNRKKGGSCPDCHKLCTRSHV